ncbi:MAG TPA: flagellar basal body protein [Caulobacteraceae bacterium]|jgi:hypothetical protein
MAIAATDAADRVDQLIRLTERLTGLLATEATAYEARRPHEVASQVEETARLANAYRHESARIKADPSLVASASAPARERLIRATEAFEAVLARHGRALHAAKAVAEGLVQAIAQEVADARAAISPYQAGGRQAPANASAITLNRTA